MSGMLTLFLLLLPNLFFVCFTAGDSGFRLGEPELNGDFDERDCDLPGDTGDFLEFGDLEEAMLWLEGDLGGEGRF